MPHLFRSIVTMLLKNAIFVLAISGFTFGQIPNIGFCPDYLPMANFDMDAFLGKWYEAERYFTFSEVTSRCVVTDYARAPSGRIYVSNEVTNRLTGVKRVIDGNLELAGRSGEGKLHVKYTTTPIATESTLVVLDTDYDTYAVVWSCNGLGPVHAQNAWLMTRARLPSGEVLQKAYGVLDKFKITRTFFVKTDQEGCAVAASDLNAANGITSISTIPESYGTSQKVNEDEEAKDSVVAVNQEKSITEIPQSAQPKPIAEIILKTSKPEPEKELNVVKKQEEKSTNLEEKAKQ